MQTITAQQILVPKKVYIGDTAELRCSFNNGSPALRELVSNGTTKLTLVNYNTTTQEYNIKSISLAPAGIDYYQLTVTFVPWKTGLIQLAPFEIESAELTVEFQPVQIVSLISTDSTNATTLRDTAAPLLLPGTAYKLYGSLGAFILLLIVLIRIIIKRKSLMFYINTKRLLRKYRKNKKLTLKRLRELTAGHTDSSDAAMAETIQKILRNYLEVRFDYPFTKTVTAELHKGWQTATGGLLSDAKEEAFGDIIAGFIRTDFIRYSSKGAFKDGEKQLLIEKLIADIETLEKGDDSAKL